MKTPFTPRIRWKAIDGVVAHIRLAYAPTQTHYFIRTLDDSTKRNQHGN